MVVGPRELTLVAPSCRRMAFRRWSRGLECEYPGRRRETRGREVREGSDWARFDSQSPVTACRSLQTAKSASLQISGILLLRNADGHKKSHLVQQHGCVSDDAPRRVRGAAGACGRLRAAALTELSMTSLVEVVALLSKGGRDVPTGRARSVQAVDAARDWRADRCRRVQDASAGR